MNELISIIIPVYNSEKYLKDCLNSVIKQTYKNIEIIVINDGSTDGTLHICKKMQEKDNRIKVYSNSTNKGVTFSRKKGLQEAKGAYIGFVDSDDWIEKNMYENLYHIIKKDNCQIVCSAIYKNYESKEYKECDKFSEGVYAINDYILNNMICFGNTNEYGIRYSNCNKLFLAEIIKKVYEEIDDDILYFEDSVATWLSIINSNKISITHEAYYHYRRNIVSASHKGSEKYYIAISKAFYLFKNKIDKIPHSKEIEKKIDKKMTEAIVNGLNGYYNFYQKNICCKYYIPYNLELYLDKKIILYGAGKVGQDYYKQLSKIVSDEKNIVWVDKDRILQNEIVYSPEVIKKMDYDLIMIAVLSEKIAEDIRKQLIELGTPNEKIWWKKPTNLVDLITMV